MKRNAKKTVVVIALIALMAIPSMFAYFTATDSHTNTFTVGNVAIDLTGDAFNVENAAAGQAIPYAPTVENTGANDAYVFVVLKGIEADKYDLTGTSADWTEYAAANAPAGTKVYQYAQNNGVLAADAAATDVVLNEVVLKDTIAAGTTIGDLEVAAYAVQTGLENDTVAGAWAVANDTFTIIQ